MTGRNVALALSVTLNVVLIAAIVAGLWMAREAWRDRGDRHGPDLFEAASTLPGAEQDKLRDDMRDAAHAARADFHQARDLRRQAAAAAAAQPYDRGAVLQALRQANAAEMRGRGKLDERLTTVFETLSPRARKTLAPGLEHRSRRLHSRSDRHEGPQAAPAQR
jgi:uncharacterized membrane protein